MIYVHYIEFDPPWNEQEINLEIPEDILETPWSFKPEHMDDVEIEGIFPVNPEDPSPSVQAVEREIREQAETILLRAQEQWFDHLESLRLGEETWL